MDDESKAIEISNCPLCGKIVKSSLEKHFEAEHKEFECPFCGLLFDTEFVLNQHLSTVHDELGESGYVNKSKNSMPSRDECNFNLTSDWVAKNTSCKDVIEIDVEAEHEKMSSAKECFTCPICQIKIKDEQWLEIHVDSHFNENANEMDSESMNRNYSTASFSEKSIKNSHCLGAAAASPNKSSFPLEYKQFNKSRTASASSLAANVDENFEIDQVITLSDCNMIMDDNNSIDYGDRLAETNSKFVKLNKIFLWCWKLSFIFINRDDNFFLVKINIKLKFYLGK
jgi:transcription elongation factor Elf1